MDSASPANAVEFGPLLLSAAGSVLAILSFLALIWAGKSRDLERHPLHLARAAALCIAYCLTAVLGLQWAAVNGAGSPVWPAAGVGLAGLLLGGVRLWPAILIGRIAAAVATGSDQPWWAELMIALGNTASAAFPAMLLMRWLRIDMRLTAIRDIVRLAIAAAAGGALAAIVGMGVLELSSGLGAETALSIGIGWWLGASVGALLVAPAMLTWSYPAAWRMSVPHWFGLAVLLVTTAAISIEVFFGDTLTFLRTWYVYPAVIWVAVAYRVRGVALAVLIVATAATWSATMAAGPFTSVATAMLGHITLAQQFVTITSFAALILAAAADERRGLEALNRSEALEHSIVDSAVDPIIVIDERGAVVSFNPAAERTFGYDRAEILGQNVSILMPEPHRSAHDGYLERYHRTGEAKIIGIGRQVEGLRKDGTTFPLDLSVAGWDADGSRFYTGIIHDQTQRVLAEKALRASERRLAMAIEASGGAVYEQTVPASDDRYISRELYEMLGYQASPVGSEDFDAWVTDQIHPDDLERREALREAFIEGREPRLEVEMRMRNAAGNWIWVRSHAQALERDSDGRVRRLSGMLIDITARKLAESHVEHLAHHDALTGLSNRALFAEQLAEATQRADIGSFRAGLILVDLDHFKSVNDTHGHPVGDSLLQVVTERLKNSVRPGDTAARLGGDEFAIVVPDARSRDDVRELARRLRDALAQPALIGDLEIQVSASLGFAVYPDHAATLDLLMRHADLALYEAKGKGRGTVCGFRTDLEEAAKRRSQTEIALRDAIRNDELILHYQPQFDLGTGQVRCAEALVRWRRNGKMIAPEEFIGIAERSGLIQTLGAWVIREACRQQALWRADGFDVKIGINVSSAEAGAEDFIACLDRSMAEFGIPSDTIEFEITEGLLMDAQSEPIQLFLKACQERGIGLAIDDFGMGYSSLGHLARLPISKVKVDRAFVSQMDQPDEALIEAVVTVFHGLGKRVVAEGVETQAQMDFLRTIGCDDAQGYLLAEPVEPATLAPLLRRLPPSTALPCIRARGLGRDHHPAALVAANQG